MSSAIFFNFDQSKSLSSGNVLTHIALVIKDFFGQGTAESQTLTAPTYKSDLYSLPKKKSVHFFMLNISKTFLLQIWHC